MSHIKSPQIVSSQTRPHKNLSKLVARYQQSEWQESIPKHAYDAFAIASRFVAGDPVILDSGCGVGESSYRLARHYPDKKVLAIDKSARRLARSHKHGECPDNLLILQADCVHLWRLIHEAEWAVLRHYLFYPNPWPKPGQLQRRWHAHPIFPTLVALGGVLTMRTNWLIYAQEFAQALAQVKNTDVTVELLMLSDAITPFERKYINSQHDLYQVHMTLSS